MMAFRFKNKAKEVAPANQSTDRSSGDSNGFTPKLTSAQLNQLAKLYPPWLKDNTALRQLPGVYQGVLGQVQLQPGIEEIERKMIGKQEKQTDYMNKFTDTERVHQLLSASQLPNETLATIWAHVNKTYPGKLTNREVCLALALIAIFQRLDKENSCGITQSSSSYREKDPFNLVRLEKKPLVPTLYPSHSSNNNSDNDYSIKGIVQSKYTSENLTSTKGLLVDILSSDEASKEPDCPNHLTSDSCDSSDLDKRVKDVILNNRIGLIDMDGFRFEIEFNRTTRAWCKVLQAMKSIFKRSFDILNVENSRQSSIEALKTPRGSDFGRNLSLCYPIAHNIKLRFDQLNSIQIETHEQSNKNSSIRGIFDKKYALLIDDLMTSINEYWAVLINLLHESGQTKIIESIMDGLIQKSELMRSASIEDIAAEFTPRSDKCLICHSAFYLNPDYGFSSKELIDDVLELEHLSSGDGQHYYHPKCASFWINQVDSNDLPFSHECVDQTILRPNFLD